jgi:hypothetical protein
MMKKQTGKKQTKNLKQGKKLQATKPLTHPNIELSSWSFGASN